VCRRKGLRGGGLCLFIPKRPAYGEPGPARKRRVGGSRGLGAMGGGATCLSDGAMVWREVRCRGRAAWRARSCPVAPARYSTEFPWRCSAACVQKRLGKVLSAHGRHREGLLLHRRATIATRTGAWGGQRGRVQGDAFVAGWGSACSTVRRGAREGGREEKKGCSEVSQHASLAYTSSRERGARCNHAVCAKGGK
jgi:hypothetical protein